MAEQWFKNKLELEGVKMDDEDIQVIYDEDAILVNITFKEKNDISLELGLSHACSTILLKIVCMLFQGSNYRF